jgi:hypothetical protein
LQTAGTRPRLKHARVKLKGKLIDHDSSSLSQPVLQQKIGGDPDGKS